MSIEQDVRDMAARMIRARRHGLEFNTRSRCVLGLPLDTRPEAWPGWGFGEEKERKFNAVCAAANELASYLILAVVNTLPSCHHHGADTLAREAHAKLGRALEEARDCIDMGHISGCRRVYEQWGKIFTKSNQGKAVDCNAWPFDRFPFPKRRRAA